MRRQSAAAIDTTNCDREAIHIPGAILPHGAMLAVNPATLLIEQLAGDTAGLLGRDAAALAGAHLSALFSAAQINRLQLSMQNYSLSRPRHLLDPMMRVMAERPIDASVHLSGDVLVIEVEDADLANRHAVDPLACVQDMIDGLGDTPDLQACCQFAAERVRSVTGYDRVMVYRFMPDGSGWVYAECRQDRLTPFLDLHYPASDIPKQARALYLNSWLRLITEVDYTPAPLQPPVNPRTGSPLDMSFATLRDVSAVHREYLRNMGVDASMSISIIVAGELWGLISCHHCTPRRLPRHLRAVCELFGSMFSLQLEARLRAEQLEMRLLSREALAKIMQSLAQEDDYAAGLISQRQALVDYIAAGGLALRAGESRGGIAIRVNHGVTMLGDTPDDDQISALTDWLTQKMENFEGVFATDRLSEIFPPAKAYTNVAAGLLAVSVSREPRDFILWFRPEVVQTVRWGGDPDKPVTVGPNGIRLTPRKSFEAWTETVAGRSSPWSLSDNDAAFDLRVSLLEIVLRRIDAAARERLRAWQQEQLLMAELDHRVKNTLANIQAIVSQTSRSATSLEGFTEGLDRRIRSMSRAHSLLTKSRWEAVSLKTLILEELDAYKSSSANFALVGTDVMLEPKAALALSLAIHELATNAAKFGSLSVAGGRVDINWQLDTVGGLNLVWQESGGPPVKTPKMRGFGSTLIERALAMETGGRPTLAFEPAGVKCTIALPASAVHKAVGTSIAVTIEHKAPVVPAVPVIADPRILIVEDSALVVMVLEDVMAGLGWEVVGPALRLVDALVLARDGSFDAALLDINLHGEMSWDVAAILQDRNIPFIFTTGYDSGTVLPPRFEKAWVLGKPYKSADIVSALQTLLR
ncbi:HWE histidine kinase domain-containing protein [Sandarakinorhabdus sp.]|uniref:HWE histidine kinase domain-containing protein n=1 Tax=Sandarakinorhabdus sp. TaxID=1916663 RepID=UPI003F6EC943